MSPPTHRTEATAFTAGSPMGGAEASADTVSPSNGGTETRIDATGSPIDATQAMQATASPPTNQAESIELTAGSPKTRTSASRRTAGPPMAAAKTIPSTAGLPITHTEANVGTVSPPIPLTEAIRATAGLPNLPTEASNVTAGPPNKNTKTTSPAAAPPIVVTETRTGAAGPPTVATEANRDTAAPPSDLTEATPTTAGPPLGGLRTCAEALTDAIKARISVENRVKRGGGAVALQGEPLCAGARGLEEAFRKQLLDTYRAVVPEHIQEWAAGIPGLATGELFPRIYATLGDPRIATPYHWDDGAQAPTPGEPYQRSLHQLWQYAGAGDPDMVPRADVLGHSPSREEKLAAGKRTQLRPLLYAFSSSLVMSATPVTKEGSKFYGRPRSQAAADSPYYQIFLAAKAAAQDKKHHRQCQNKKRPPMKPNGCGTVLHPEWGEPGSPWRPGHILMHAHRMVHKEFLRDLWVVAGK